MSYFGVPLSGLIASQDQLQSVSNNLANLDTVGYKDQNTFFQRSVCTEQLVERREQPDPDRAWRGRFSDFNRLHRRYAECDGRCLSTWRFPATVCL